jgi:thiamine kinase-like enzyme
LSSVSLSASAIEAAKGRLERDVNQLFGPELSGWALQQLGNDVRWRHCDLHAENILVDDRSGEVTAVVDWEWADVTVAALDQSRILAVGAYQVGREWGLEAAGAIDPDTLLVAFALHTVPHAHQPGQSAFYDAILSSVRARAGAA